MCFVSFQPSVLALLFDFFLLSYFVLFIFILDLILILILILNFCIARWTDRQTDRYKQNGWTNEWVG